MFARLLIFKVNKTKLMQSLYRKCPETHTYDIDVMLGCVMPKTEPTGE